MSPRGSERLAEPPPESPTGRRPTSAERELPGLSLEEIEVLLRVGDILRTVRFGSVLIVVQDGKVVQIEMAEKIRLP